ncbi:hypothetical protein K493DRAFT_297308 [Basidiobolus meristosporus CBS 931.73]|uniref:Aquaporin-like protein n=1 Tax=Basidiobolus meristosporus CBS 931.73 TaxID=1314790 RepID=A0A1Y1Z0J5_9FUNG|nr:hypothetical protein K493DRAFT_297308 [Basidiobolus meristosporus CBS 931.73]|eukprot:ORY03810.1 hypothetical protein K493DRAFT_297308 [Basidiobolus meristosporus CBS 931.73]
MAQMFDWSEFRNPKNWRSGDHELYLMALYVLVSCGVTAWAVQQQKVFDPVVGPPCVALALGVNVFVSGGITDGFCGVGANPAKFLGVVVASGIYQEYRIPCPRSHVPGHEAESSKKC